MQQLLEHHKQWCAVYTKAKNEEFAELNLRLRGIDTFFPKLFIPNSTKRKKQIVPLFPSYLFVRLQLDSKEQSSIVWCPGVKRLLSFDGTPAIVEESLMAFLMHHAGSDGIISARRNLKVGQRVSIDGGPFDGLAGIIQEPPSAKGRVKVLLQLLKRPTKVDVPVQFIKADWIISKPLEEA